MDNWQTQGPNSSWTKVQIAPVGEAFRTDSLRLRAARGSKFLTQGFFQLEVAVEAEGKVGFLMAKSWLSQDGWDPEFCFLIVYGLSVVIPVPVSHSVVSPVWPVRSV